MNLLALTGYAILAAICWGSADFLAARVSVLLDSGHVAALISVVALILAAGFSTLEPPESNIPLEAFVVCFASGAVAVIGLGMFFGLLSRYPASQVAPSSAAASSATPAIIGIFIDGAVGLIRIVGLITAVIAVCLGSFDKSAPNGRSTYLPLARPAIAGVLMGVYLATTGYYSDYGLQPVAAAHFGAVMTQVSRRKFPTERPALVCAVGCVLAGFLYHLAALSYRYSSSLGELSVSGAIASMYPLVTVVLAIVILRHRPNLIQIAGLALSVFAIGILNIS
ncbi:EamA family transporter [Frankia sp. Mgl5]|uniref:EamA family transporter n=1 Tax=Frankia sp. Mgl5 TaxID=2933793 RepID=UPI00200F8C83|nr:EamA family transporter [Frankia sp. Mgl5]MCK9930791.1 EamA family transporter [Frankia sp. Mgl5]